MPFPARLNNGQELAKFLSSIQKFYIPTSGAVSDPTTAAIVADDDDITVTTLASFTSGDYIIVNGTGGMELNQLGTKPGSGAIPVLRPFMLAQDNGATVYKATRVNLGYIEDAGGTFAASLSKQAIGAANSRSAIAYIDSGTAEPQFSFSLRESNLRNILTAFGVDEDSVKGSGTSTDQYRALISRDNIGSQGNFCLRASGLYVTGKTINFDILNCFPEINLSAQFVGKGQPTTWGVSVKYTDLVVWISA